MRVETGCRDCVRCNNSSAGEFARRWGLRSAKLMSFGIVSVYLAFTPNCKGCGHKKSLHEHGDMTAMPVQIVNAVPAPAPAPQGPAAGWYPTPEGGSAFWDGATWTARHPRSA